MNEENQPAEPVSERSLRCRECGVWLTAAPPEQPGKPDRCPDCGGELHSDEPPPWSS
jgi:rRNA maturation protein Nop10